MKQIIDSELFTFENNKKWLRKKDIRENLKKFYELNNTKSFSQKNYDNWPVGGGRPRLPDPLDYDDNFNPPPGLNGPYSPYGEQP